MKKLLLSTALVLSAGSAFGIVSQPVKSGNYTIPNPSVPNLQISNYFVGGKIPEVFNYEEQCLQPMNIGGPAAREWAEKCERMRQQLGKK